PERPGGARGAGRPPLRRDAACVDSRRAPCRCGNARRRLHALRDAGRAARPRGVARGGRAWGVTSSDRRGAPRTGRARSGRRPCRHPQRERTRVTPGDSLHRLREAKPLVHQITNYVVMNETANATLALGALPVMAHAREEVEEMVTLADALVLNIGTLSPHWVEAMLMAGKAANSHGVPVVFDPVGAGATRYRTDT